MGNDTARHRQRDLQDLQPGLLNADDQTIRRVLAVVDNVADPAINQAVLDNLRPRLAALRPVHPLRLTRLLFIPLDPLTVPLRGWCAGDPTVPRPALGPIAKIVRTGLGDLAVVVDRMIAGHSTDATEAITRAGDLLWPRAAEIVAAAPPPSDWAATGLAPAAYAEIAAGITAVLRCAAQLRSLALDEQQGGLTLDAASLGDILAEIGHGRGPGCAMLARLVVMQIPTAFPMLLQAATTARTRDERERLQSVVDGAVEATLADMERNASFGHAISRGRLAEAGDAVRRVLALLSGIEAAKSYAGQRTRLETLRQKLGEACQARFTQAINEGLVAPLATAEGPVDGAAQTALEGVARELRKFEMTARKLAGTARYDALLQTASDAVLEAADAGTLTLMRKFRLIEILAGPDVAGALYFEACGAR